MSMSKKRSLAAITPFLLAVWSTGLLAADAPGLGVPVSPAEEAAVDFVVMPDGRGLPEGSGTAAAGSDIYRRECQVCHGEGGQGGMNDRLVGGLGTLTSDAPVKTVGSYWPYATTLFDYLRRAMPYPAPGSLSADELYALTAYLLAENGIVDRDQVIDARSLPAVKMPNRDGFVWAWPEPADGPADGPLD